MLALSDEVRGRRVWTCFSLGLGQVFGHSATVAAGQDDSGPFAWRLSASKSDAGVPQGPGVPQSPGVPQVPGVPQSPTVPCVAGVSADVWDWSSAGGTDPELYWATRFWVPLDEEGYGRLAPAILVTRPLFRRSKWRAKWERAKDVHDTIGFDAKSWGLASAGPIRPAFIPTVARGGFESHQMLHRTLTPKAWMRLRTIGPESFAKCGLVYVELGAIISRYYRYPYGVLDETIHQTVMDMMFPKDKKDMSRGELRGRHNDWVTGCLLQHADADTTRLTEFCANDLGYNPCSFKKHPFLQCLTRRLRVSTAIRGAPERLNILQITLAGLPVVSAEKYAQLTDKQLYDDMRQTAKEATVGALTQEQLVREDWDKALAECEPAEAESTGGAGSEECRVIFLQRAREKALPGRRSAVDPGRHVDRLATTPSGTLKDALDLMPPGTYTTTRSRGMISQKALSRKRRIPLEYPDLAKKRGIEGGSGSTLDGHSAADTAAVEEPALDVPTVDVPVIAVPATHSVSHSDCMVRCDSHDGQSSKAPTIQQLEWLVNHDLGSVEDDRFMDTFAEAVWKEYGPLLSIPMDHLMANGNDLPLEQLAAGL
ncbi:hypothetical protein GNI_184380 [Gregarina niphandrodes]|uniref:Uncharacterized protein n=1 Tax=Gregarina niphandrodes TaxID=110365 RepID=A0A023AWP3_GRENI|nr:hypothetical protein GNI_184380 [Gregarina niphandrodes]EZG43161.1 hypothetical protein GNI_184380 [Gregarina niphandrodes]|eukprot:XP_011133583.1 hypothetical protein GNI_184380 [Gregarina niphandrodes]